MAGEREFESISVHGESGANLTSRLPRWSRPHNSMTFRSGYGHRMGRARDRKFADSALEGAGFEPSVPLRAPGVLVVSVLVLCRLSVSGESSSGDMSPSRNLGCVTRYRRFESGFLKRRVHVSRRPGRCRVENRGFGSPSPFEWCIQHPRAAPQSGSVSDEPACTTVPAGHRV